MANDSSMKRFTWGHGAREGTQTQLSKRRDAMNKQTVRGWLLGIVTVLLATFTTMPAAFAGAHHVRWDIISVVFGPPNTLNPGGFADANAPNNGGKIRLTGSGTFVAPAGLQGGSAAATGGGTWETFSPTGTSTGSGTYVVTGLVRFELANFQLPGNIDNIGNIAEAANGNAVLRIEYDDGSRGILGVYCHGPGAPDGIAEGISATKGFKTYVEVLAPAPGVDANRTLFHVLK